MLIGIDGRPLVGPSAGSGRYVMELCKVLEQVIPNAHFVIFSNAPITLPWKGPRWSVPKDFSALGAMLSPFEWYQLRAGRLAEQSGVDVFWGGANFLPLCLPRRIRAVMTVHDVVHRVYPQSIGIKHRLAYHLFFRASLRRADVVACNSEGTSARLRAFGYRSGDIIVKPAASDRFTPPSAQDVGRMRERLGIRGRYLVSVSTLEPRKNLDTLVEAYLEMRDEGELHDVSLVLVGQSGWKTGRLTAAVAKAGSDIARIHLTGYVPDELLPALYAAAEAVVMPSIYEGFGMPVLEASLCGARVVATDIPEIREAGGEHVTYVQPSVDGIKAGVRAALQRTPIQVKRMDAPRWEIEGRKLANALISAAMTESNA